VDISVLSLILLALGVTGLVGTYLVGWFLKASPYGAIWSPSRGGWRQSPWRWSLWGNRLWRPRHCWRGKD